MEASEKEIIGDTEFLASAASNANRGGDNDCSVVSAVTDPASIEGTMLVPSTDEELTLQESADAQDENEVPLQVVLGDSSSAQLVEQELVGEQKSEPEQKVDTAPADKDGDAEVEEVPMEEHADKTLNEDMSDYEGLNQIVERSPGSRYVRFMEKLGSGASKDVYRAYDTQEGIEVAWNVVSLGTVPSKAERNRIINEVRLLERLHHENIISFHGSWVNRERQEVIFVTEILSSGTLKSFINKVQVIRWKIAKRWAVQILRGLAYLHSQDPPIIHRDLKCENIFINGTSGDLRIGDLGLSTVHTNGKQLSVLGTPEFMAPDMYYEDRSYDEKVDVYAFGMCLLEIFTKEIPYAECNNPGQIYKKVMAGEPPEVLSRLHSKHAREFVKLCLGKRDEKGNFVRPTVSELLQHEFLVKRANDDDEVVVRPPLRKLAIPETQSITTISNRKVNADVLNSLKRSESPSATLRNTIEDDANDQFEEMQESEISMRKVKVMMGRGQELEEDDLVEPDDDGEITLSEKTLEPPASDTLVAATARGQSNGSNPDRKYPVKAYVIENQNARPYNEDTLKLILALPVDGQTQNVEFDFDMVEDDPVQVAKEMVQELSIPSDAVLEISETISGLARTARMRLGKHSGRMHNQQYQSNGSQPGQQQQQQMHVQHQGQQAESQFQQQNRQGSSRFGVYSEHRVPPETGGSQDRSQFQQQGLPPMQHSTAVAHHIASGSVPLQEPHQYQQYVAQPQGGQQHGGVPLTQQHGGQHHQQQQLHMPYQGNYQGPPMHQQAGHFGQGGNFSSQQQQHSGSNQDPNQHNQMHQHHAPPQQLNHGAQHQNVQPAVVAHEPQVQMVSQYATSNNATYSNGAPSIDSSFNYHAASSAPPPPPPQHFSSVVPAARSRGAVKSGDSPHAMSNPKAVTQTSQPGSSAPAQHQYPPPAPPRAASDTNETSGGITAPDQAKPPSLVLRSESTGMVSVGVDGGGDLTKECDSDIDEDLLAELKKLDEEYEKNIQITKKVFDTRMDKIRRSQDEKESLHQKTLEKHERERAEYEKRRAEEEKKQQERLIKLQQERDLKRESITKFKRMQKNGMTDVALASTTTSNSVPDLGFESQTVDLTHSRTLSSTSSIPSTSPATISHKASNDPAGGTHAITDAER
jgi:WNK lysine deficient protein kinase